MGILYNRLLIILNEESTDSTYYHIALVMLQHIDELEHMAINDLAQICAVSKATISRFIRFIGYEDYSDFRYAVPFRDNRYDYSFNYVANVMEYMEERSVDALIEAIQDDIRTTYETLDWSAVDRLVRDLDEYDRIGVFGLMFSETAAMDFQIKLGYNKKIRRHQHERCETGAIHSAGREGHPDHRVQRLRRISRQLPPHRRFLR